ncbi:hypothetical protein Neosp_007520 [[Neocosmospora] mangrovei]
MQVCLHVLWPAQYFTDAAVSHIFCLECAERLGSAGQETERRNTCPACHSQLKNPDDAVIVNLNPSEEYKTTLLSGLSPNVIMECAGRALSFWAYQTTQDMYYQQHLYKTLTEKYSALTIQFEKTVSDATTEIDGLQQRLSGMTAEQDALRRKNEEIGQAFKEKSRKVLQLQELYDKVKRRAELGQIRKAASAAVDLTLETPPQPDQGIAGNNGVPESDNTPAFNYRRANGLNMNTGMPRSYPAVTREGTLWPRMGGTSRPKLSPQQRRLRAFIVEEWEDYRQGLQRQYLSLGTLDHPQQQILRPLAIITRELG